MLSNLFSFSLSNFDFISWSFLMIFFFCVWHEYLLLSVMNLLIFTFILFWVQICLIQCVWMEHYPVTICTVDSGQAQTVGSFNWRFVRQLTKKCIVLANSWLFLLHALFLEIRDCFITFCTSSKIFLSACLMPMFCLSKIKRTQTHSLLITCTHVKQSCWIFFSVS